MALRIGLRPTSILRGLFWGAAIFAFTMAVLPKPPTLPGEPSDKIQHVIAFLTLSALAASAYPRLSLVRLGAALSGLGLLIEFVQLIPALNRDSELLDWVADTAAVILVLGLWAMARAWRKKLRQWRE